METKSFNYYQARIAKLINSFYNECYNFISCIFVWRINVE
ncbi:conserved hypothetical protein (plasmid) [Borreliella afzelii PKo]|uniref:Uncharacterized protein n=1 Tax=Borreliella afzelii (strain PKo) TaxID=390236 RepID=Q0SL64_BORAP|nr:hypothetical protein BAPKO_4524 [Borreliella afzelii PKo]AEL70396.1 conserved hypothetical protein [Borreliella afzelii PKo]